MTAIEKYLLNLNRRARSDWVSARLLWNLGFVAQAVWLIQQSVEKYLKVLWVSDKKFPSEKDLVKQLKGLGKGKFDTTHDLAEIFSKLDPGIQRQLGRPNILLIKSEALRYNGSFLYGDKVFNFAEAFVKKIRKLLNEPLKASLYEEIKCVSNKPLTEAVRRKHDKIIREILSLKNKTSRKEQYKQIKRKITSLL